MAADSPTLPGGADPARTAGSNGTRQRWLARFQFWLLVGLGLFLAMAAVMSLPRLREVDKPNNDVSAEALAKSLEGLKVSAAALQKYYTDVNAGDPIDVLAPEAALLGAGPAPRLPLPTAGTQVPSNAVSTAAALGSVDAAALPDSGPPDDADAFAYLTINPSARVDATRQTALRDANDFALDFHALWRALVQDAASVADVVVQNQNDAETIAVKEFGLGNVGLQGSHEEREQFMNITRWFFAMRLQGTGDVRRCTEQLGLSRSDFASWALLARLTLVTAADDRIPLEVVNDHLHELRDRTGWLNNKVPSLQGACVVPKWTDCPGPIPLGNSLGRMRWIAGWLLDANSIPLALTVGMAGFGLLGAAISTFVAACWNRDGEWNNNESPMERMNFSLILVRGVSAAVVVFLAVEGGLAVLSGNESTPNPYMVLLACFVSAVFSERVWQSTSRLLRQRLDKLDGTPESQEKLQVQTVDPSAGLPAPATRPTT